MICEMSRRKENVYKTPALDLDQQRRVRSGEGRSEEPLRRFFDEGGAARSAKIGEPAATYGHLM